MAITSFAFNESTSTQFVAGHAANQYFLKSMEVYANNLLNAQGHVFLNEVLDMLGIHRTRGGAINGWVKGNEDKRISFDIDNPLNKEKNIENQPFRLQFNIDGEIIDKIDKKNKKEYQMVGIPRVRDEDITISPTRTYVIVVHDLVAPNEARFEKLQLPESFDNDSKHARYCYELLRKDRGEVVLASVAFENYMATVTDIVEEVIFEPPQVQKKRFFDTRSTSLTEDMKEVRQMLDSWNDEQKHPSTTYAMIMRSVLHKLAFQEKFIADLKKELLNL